MSGADDRQRGGELFESDESAAAEQLSLEGRLAVVRETLIRTAERTARGFNVESAAEEIDRAGERLKLEAQNEVGKIIAEAARLRKKAVREDGRAQRAEISAMASVLAEKRAKLTEARAELEQRQNVLSEEDAQYRQAQHAVLRRAQELGISRSAPKKPALLMTQIPIVALLGLLFGVLASVTIIDILSALLLQPGEPVPGSLKAAALLIGCLAGFLITLLPLWLAEHAATIHTFHRWAPFATGLLLAAGLGGYRLIEQTDHGIEVSVTPIGVTLMFAEVALVILIEFFHYVVLNKWEAYQAEKRLYDKEIRPLLDAEEKERLERDLAEQAVDQQARRVEALENEIRAIAEEIARKEALYSEAQIEQELRALEAEFEEMRATWVADVETAVGAAFSRGLHGG